MFCRSCSLLAVTALMLSATACHREAAKAYPFDVCLVSGEKLGSHGDPYVFERDGQEVKLCCESCFDEFDANADKLMKQIADKTKP
jgi:hypothetical protein